MGENRLKVGLGLLTVLATPIAVNSLVSNEVHAAEEKQVVVEKQVTEEKAVKADDKVIVEKQKVEKQKVSEKLVEDKKIEAVEEKTLTEKPALVEKQTIIEKEVETKNSVVPKEGGKPAEEKKEQVKTGYDNGIFYDNGKLANWWYDDGTAWYFFQNGKKHTGEGKDNAGVHYFVDGKYGTGEYNGKIYIDGKETTPIKYGYKNGLFFADSKLANWWYDDGTAWYFFQNGKKYTGKGKDNAGYHYFVNGKYDNNVPALNMPQYYQNDARWGRKVYGMSNLAAAGCVPTSLAMVFSGLGKPVLPTAVADTISNGGGLNYGGFGTSAKGAADAIKKYGYNYRVLKTKEQLVNALRNGESVLATVQQGYFVRSAYETHAVVLSGFDNGKVRALDPYNKNATGKWYNINEIWNQRSTAASDTMLGGSFTAIEK